MASVGLLSRSDTGNTEAVAGMIQKELGSQLVEVHDIAKSTKADIDSFDLLILGIPTLVTPVSHRLIGMTSSPNSRDRL
jgi:flavodoxin I